MHCTSRITHFDVVPYLCICDRPREAGARDQRGASLRGLMVSKRLVRGILTLLLNKASLGVFNRAPCLLISILLYVLL
jgi:hypothetical protein